MIEDANPKCEYCDGEGEEWFYYINHRTRQYGSDWVYCSLCFPESEGVPEYENYLYQGWERCTWKEYEKYRKQGYEEHSF